MPCHIIEVGVKPEDEKNLVTATLKTSVFFTSQDNLRKCAKLGYQNIQKSQLKNEVTNESAINSY